MSEKRLFVSDLDGTLLRDDATLSAFAKATLSRLLSDGLPFTVATARSAFAVRCLMKGLHLSLPIIECNGAYLTDLNTGRHLLVHALKPSVARGVLELFESTGACPFVHATSDEVDYLGFRELQNDAMRWYYEEKAEQRDPRLRSMEAAPRFDREQIACYTFLEEKGLLQRLAKKLEQHFSNEIRVTACANAYCEGYWELNVQSSRAGKAQTLHVLAKRLGVPLKAITVFGDNFNDMDMFSAAGRAIAVRNAVPALKQAAHQVIGSNQEDAVIRYLLEQD